jgi:Na+-transporting methylmalonyl-CoA/oxaloacetate decarboxylase gamma subunit
LNPLLEGLNISLLGLSLTFAALGLLILIIWILDRAFRAAPVSRPPTPSPEARERPISTLERESEEEEIAVAIAIALSQLRSVEICRAGLGRSLEDGRGRWWSPSAHRLRSAAPSGRGRS